MKRVSVIVAVTLYAVFAIADVIYNFIANDTAHYFGEQPHRLLFVAAIGIGGGLIAFLFYRLSPRLRRGVKLFTLGSAASLVTLCGIYFGCQAARPSVIGNDTLALVLLPAGVLAALLWFEFYQIFRNRVL